MSPLTPVGDDRDALRRTFALFPSGVAAIAAEVDGTPRVLVASTFQVGISADPPLVLFAVQRTSTSWPLLRRAPRLGVSVLGEVHEATARRLASKVEDRFAGVPTRRTPTGAVLIDDAPIHLECAVEGEMPAGDHEVVLLRVHALATDPAAAPLVFHGSTFRRLSPPVSPVDAPQSVEEAGHGRLERRPEALEATAPSPTTARSNGIAA